MAGHVDFGHDRHVMRGGISDDSADVRLAVIAAIARRLARRWICAGRARFLPTATDFGEARIAIDLDPPALIVAQMPMKGVELGHRHPVDQLLDIGDRLEVSNRIQHHPAPAERRLVGDGDGRDAAILARCDQLPQRFRAVIKPGVARGGNRGASGRYHQPIGLRALHRGIPPESYRPLGRKGERRPAAPRDEIA